VAQGQSAVATIAPTTTGVANQTTTSTVAETSTTTPPEVKAAAAPATPENPAPQVPALQPAQAAVVIDGKAATVSLTRVNDQVIVSTSGVKVTISVLGSNGSRVPLDSIGGLRFGSGDKVVLSAEGLAAGGSASVWVFSTPINIGTVTVDAAGKVAGTFTIPPGLGNGSHRIAIKANTADGKPLVLGVGVSLGKPKTTSTASRIFIAVPLTMAAFLGFFIPTTLRRRRRRRTA
jgi:hypothetical protein